MTYISSLQNIHKHGTFGDYENKNEDVDEDDDLRTPESERELRDLS